MIGTRSPAYILVSSGGQLVKTGGDLGRYGLNDLKPGGRVSDVPLLSGLFPPGRRAALLPCVGMDGYAAADIHSIPAEDGVWFLLLDASVDQQRQVELHQTVNELHLLREQLVKSARLPFEAEEVITHSFRREISLLTMNLDLLSDTPEVADELVFDRISKSITDLPRRLEKAGGLLLTWVGGSVIGVFGILASRPAPAQLALDAARVFSSPSLREDRRDEPVALRPVAIATGQALIGLPLAHNSRVRCFGHAVNRALWLGVMAEPDTILLDRPSFESLSEEDLDFTEISMAGPDGSSTPVYRCRRS